MFAFAADKSRPAPEGSAPLAVLARQLPRLLVSRLNDGLDRGIRFFPFMGVVEGERRFFDVDEMFEPNQLRAIHGQEGIELIVDGEISADRVAMRILSSQEDGRVLLEVEAPLDPLDPWPALHRLMFELTGQLGWHGAVPALPNWSGPALGWYLIAKDEQLGLDADMPCPDPARTLRAAREALLLEPDAPEFGAVLIDTCRTMLTRGIDGEVVGDALLEAMRSVDGVPLSVCADAALIVEVTRGIEYAAPIYVHVARRDPAHPQAPLKAGFGLYQQGRTAEGLEILRAAYDAGNRDPALRAQLAAAEEECGDVEQRDRLLEGLADEEELPVPVARLVASFLVDKERAAQAIALIDRVRDKGVEHAGLWLERGRAQVSSNDLAGARLSLERCLAIEPPAEVRVEAKRLLRLTEDEELLPSIEELEDALREDNSKLAVVLARQMIRRRPELAEAWLLLGVVRQRNRQYRRATRAYLHAVQLQPDLGDAHNRLGVLLASRGRDIDGYNHLRQAVELMPHDSSPWLHLAQVCLRLGWKQEGAEAFERAQRIGGHEAEIAEIRTLFESDD